MTRKGLPKYVYRDRGYLRFIRRSRGISVMIHEEEGSPEFWDHYNRLLKGKPAPKPVKRNFEALILSYFESDAYKKLKPRTQSDYRRYISHIRQIWGDKDPAKIETHHIFELHRANAEHWRQANYLVQVMVVLMNHARLIGFIKKEHGNPAKGIPLFKQEGDGWEPWPEDVRAEFEALASPRARLVYELCIGTGQRIGDVLKMDWAHICDEGFDLTQGKTQKPLWIPLTDRLKACLDAQSRKSGRLVTDAQGQAVSYRTIAQEMRAIKARMKHPDAARYKTHGLRKNATIELYLAGCDDEMVKAVTGHSGVEMLKKYGGQVRQRELASRAQEARNRMARVKNEP
jgi:integrase